MKWHLTQKQTAFGLLKKTASLPGRAANQDVLIDAYFYFGHLTNCFPIPVLTGKTKNNKNISQGICSQHMETNPSVVLAGETNLAVKGTFETEESGKNSMC